MAVMSYLTTYFGMPSGVEQTEAIPLALDGMDEGSDDLSAQTCLPQLVVNIYRKYTISG